MKQINDIQIFIMTHNRAEYLKHSIESILNQTTPPNEIIILDNESTDNTAQVVAQYPQCKHIVTKGFLGNFNKARELANKDYIMLYHDDDILNPHYLEFAVKLINYFNPSIITTKYTRFYENSKPDIKKPSTMAYCFDTQFDFIKYQIGVECVSYSSAIYKTSAFLSEQLEYDKYGKFNDWSFMAKMAAYGKSIITADENMNYARIHSNQDTRNIETALTGQQIINWDKYFYSVLGDDELMSKSYHFLRSKYDQFTTPEFKSQTSFEELRQSFLGQCPKCPVEYNQLRLNEIKKELEGKFLYDCNL